MAKRNAPRAGRIPTILTPEVAAMVKGMLGRKDRQSDIASFFQINQGRIVEIRSGQKFKNVAPAPLSALPPPGPYLVVQKAAHERAAIAEATLNRIMAVLDRATTEIRSEIGTALREDARSHVE